MKSQTILLYFVMKYFYEFYTFAKWIDKSNSDALSWNVKKDDNGKIETQHNIQINELQYYIYRNLNNI